MSRKFDNMILLTYKLLLFAVLLCEINAYFLNSVESTPGLKTSSHGSDQTNFLKNLYKLKKNQNVYKDDKPRLPKWHSSSSKENSVAHEEYIDGSDNYLKFYVPLQYIEEKESQFENTLLGKLLLSKNHEPDKDCPPKDVDIAALFDCTKSENKGFEADFTTHKSSEIKTSPTASTKFRVTEEKSTKETETPTSFKTTCSNIKDISSPLLFRFICGTTSEKDSTNPCMTDEKFDRVENDQKSTTPIIINNSFQHISQGSVISMVIQVQCDKNTGKTHFIQQLPLITTPITVQNVFISPNLITKSPAGAIGSNNMVSSQVAPAYLNKYDPGPLGHVLNQQSNMYTLNNLNLMPRTTTTNFVESVSKITLRALCEEENLVNIKPNDNFTQSSSKHKKTHAKIPQPLLPLDIKDKYTVTYPEIKSLQPTTDDVHKPLMFLCQLTNDCPVSKSSTQEGFKPSKTFTQAPTICNQPQARLRTTKKSSKFLKFFTFPHVKFKGTATEEGNKSLSTAVKAKAKKGSTTASNGEESTSPILKSQVNSHLEKKNCENVNVRENPVTKSSVKVVEEDKADSACSTPKNLSSGEEEEDKNCETALTTESS